MKRVMTLLASVALSTMAFAQSADLFKPYKQTDLRVPSVPLVVNDPYFSIWSPYDELNEGDTRHWTNDEKPLEGLLRVDGVTYRFMGSESRKVLETVAPMADEQAWKGRYVRQKPADGWQKTDFDDSSWREGEGAFGTDNNSFIRTAWVEENSDIWVRRTVNLTEKDLEGELYLVFSHDDACEVYLNGTQVATGIMSLVEGVKVRLDGDKKNLLKAGKNVIAVHCYNKTGGALVDMGLYRNISKVDGSIKQARQTAVDVLATNTYYTFKCGPVDLDLVFTAPMLIDDLDLLSTPVNYISYQVRANDGRQHKVQFYLSATALIGVNKANQPTQSGSTIQKGVRYLKTGTIDQPILAKKGDGICIDWGYLYLPNFNGNVSLGTDLQERDAFVSTGQLPRGERQINAYRAAEQPTLAYTHDFGTVSDRAASYLLIGYDEVFDIEYMYERYKGYWAHDGKVSIFDAFEKLNRNYTTIMKRCKDLDRRIYEDGLKAGNKKYAEILSASYRHVIAAHKLFEDKDGNLLFFSKENNSNGCVNT
ncbi:MAG: DUF5127 domain-containing protein, partial [Prevotella sp.]|nr:DUF5127 domain-containing protein [Prevotella sp.]